MCERLCTVSGQHGQQRQTAHILTEAERLAAFKETRTKETISELRDDRKALSQSFADQTGDAKEAQKTAFRKRRRERPKRQRTRARDGPELER